MRYRTQIGVYNDGDSPARVHTLFVSAEGEAGRPPPGIYHQLQ